MLHFFPPGNKAYQTAAEKFASLTKEEAGNSVCEQTAMLLLLKVLCVFVCVCR